MRNSIIVVLVSVLLTACSANSTPQIIYPQSTVSTISEAKYEYTRVKVTVPESEGYVNNDALLNAIDATIASQVNNGWRFIGVMNLDDKHSGGSSAYGMAEEYILFFEKEHYP